MNTFTYQLFLASYIFGIRIASLFNKKAQLWLKGRQNIFDTIHQAFSQNTSPVIWLHCASLGEFEQGRPLIEKLKKDYPHYKILLTFFSPSGYEVQQHYALADYVFYLPLDGKKSAKLFLDEVNPKLVIFVKYEYWYYYLKEINSRQIPLLLISAIFRKSQPFFQPYGKLYRNMLQFYTQIFIQDFDSKKLLSNIGIRNITVCGDTRVDRVLSVAQLWKPVEKIEKFCHHHKVIVCGSTWEEDDEELNHYVNKNMDIRFIIAPHEIDEDRLRECLSFYKHSILYSEYLKTDSIENINTIIIDNIGLLKRLYNYATICFIGGGFGGDGVHNVLEAAVYQKPLVFGPVYEKYLEAVELEEQGAAFPAENTLELEEIFNQLFADKVLYQKAAAASERYIKNKSGATLQIENYIREHILK
ncbi:MAG: glycosyltransferase N-terminal domain-containing protein [Arachidicoccus sp.]|nr:glycosyltransferase N-terminal domain-containing protein [Arachidicoccus sp.]